VKLLLCGYCKDVRALDAVELTACRCGKTTARYRDDRWHADIWGDDCILLGLKNDDVYALLAARAAAEEDRRYAALVAQPPWHERAHYHRSQ
jgi:hypothetical protein